MTQAVERTVENWNRFTARLVEQRYALYGLAVMRIGYGLIIVLILLGNFTARRRIWGMGSQWYKPYRDADGYHLPFTLLDHVTAWWFFDLWYVLTLALAVAFMLGFRTRVVTPLLYVAFTTLWRQDLFVEDGGQRLLRIMLIFLVFADVSARWSLDVRRRAVSSQEPGLTVRVISRFVRKDPIRVSATKSVIATGLHNFALVTVVGQLCLVYFCAGMYKVQGSMWQDGTAIYYPLKLDTFAPWPWLSSIVYHFPIVVTAISYVSVLIQVLFPAMLLNPVTRRAALAVILGMHLGIAILMGLPLFSAAMMFADMVLIRRNTYLRIERYAHSPLSRVRLRRGIHARH